MTSLADRLRGVISNRRPVNAGPDGPAYAAGDVTGMGADEALGGDWCEGNGGRFLIIDRSYSPGHRHGHMSVADGLPPSNGIWPRLSLLADGASSSRLLFVDLETTGLAGGAGTYAFLVGCGWFEDGRFKVRQFFLASYLAERALLHALVDVASTAGAVVTYNGKSFDLPLVETRYTLHRMETPFAGLPHIDMLHPARRLWRGCEGATAGTFVDARREAAATSTCTLSVLEQALCGHVREGDVAGFEIPARYFQFVRTGDAGPIADVLEHNRLDLLSLALVTARAAQLLDEGAAGARTAREALGLGRLYERGGLFTDAWGCFSRAIELDDDDVTTRAEAFRAHATLARRMRRFEEAAASWRRLLNVPGCPRVLAREAAEALAVHLEHRLRDYQTARGFAMRSLSGDVTPARRQATMHRVARLDRKIGLRLPEAALLF
jgi:uncharacterized protein